MAPWTHTYISPQTERRMCCASREPAQNFRQYIDVKDGTGTYLPMTLDQHWNSEHMRSVRRRMLAGETLSECEVCNDKLLNTDVYRDYFWRLFQHRYDEVLAATDETGYTSFKPISWDYRFSNLCNFKCRMCGDMLSSSWETEQRQHDMIDYSNPKNNWMKPEIRTEISKFQDQQVEIEFAQAVEEHRVEEVYWVGGEPLMYDQHWRYMKRIVELGDGPRVYARYNTNLSRIDYQGVNLFQDILSKIRDWQICASIDATGKIGEYIRTGLKYDQWLDHYQQGLAAQQNSDQMRLDLTITLPGLLDLENMFELSQKFETRLLTKVTFAFGPEIIMSPLSLPRKILDRIIDNLLINLKPKSTWRQQSLIDVLENLKHRPTFEETWPDRYTDGCIQGKRRIQQLELIRRDNYTLRDILSLDSEILAWYDAIPD